VVTMARCLGNNYCDCKRCRRRRDQVDRDYARRQNGVPASPQPNTEGYGDKWDDADGTNHTVNPAKDPRVPGGYYHSQTDPDGNKETAVFDADGYMPDIKQNAGWQESPRQ